MDYVPDSTGDDLCRFQIGERSVSISPGVVFMHDVSVLELLYSVFAFLA